MATSILTLLAVRGSEWRKLANHVNFFFHPVHDKVTMHLIDSLKLLHHYLLVDSSLILESLKNNQSIKSNSQQYDSIGWQHDTLSEKTLSIRSFTYILHLSDGYDASETDYLILWISNCYYIIFQNIRSTYSWCTMILRDQRSFCSWVISWTRLSDQWR